MPLSLVRPRLADVEALFASQFGHSQKSFELNGVWYDRLHFECHAIRSGGT